VDEIVAVMRTAGEAPMGSGCAACRDRAFQPPTRTTGGLVPKRSPSRPVRKRMRLCAADAVPFTRYTGAGGWRDAALSGERNKHGAPHRGASSPRQPPRMAQ